MDGRTSIVSFHLLVTPFVVLRKPSTDTMRSGSESLSMVDVEAVDGKVSQNVELDADSDMLVVVQRAILSKMVVVRKGNRTAVTPIGHRACGRFQIKRHSGTSLPTTKVTSSFKFYPKNRHS